MPKISAKRFANNASSDMKYMFKNFNLDETTALNLALNIWGDTDPDVVWKGADPTQPGLTPDQFNDDVLENIAKSLYHVDRKRSGKDNDIVQKAVTSTTTTAVVIPTIIDPQMIDIVNRDVPFLSMLADKGMRGKTVNIPRRTAGITPEWLADDGSSITANTHTLNDINATVRYLYAGNEVSYPAIATAQEDFDIKKMTIQQTYMDFQRYKEEWVLRGRNSAGTENWNGYKTADSNGYDGVFKRVHEEVASTNEYELQNGGSIGIGDIDDGIVQIIDQGGRADFGVSDYSTANTMMQVARSYYRHNDNVTNLGSAPGKFTINQTEFFSTTQLPITTGQKSLLIADKRAFEMRTLVPDQFVEVGQNAKDTYEFFWKAYQTLVVPAPEWVYTINGGT